MKEFFEKNRKLVLVMALLVLGLVAVIAVDSATETSVVSSLNPSDGDAMKKQSEGEAMEGDAMDGDAMEKESSGDAMEKEGG